MSFESLWPHLSALHGKIQPPNAVEWKVLYASRPRPLLVPASSQAEARAAIDFFVGNRFLRWWGHAMLLLDRSLPRSRLLPLARSERFPIDELFGGRALAETRLAVQCGSPGPLRKLTVFCPGSGDENSGEICKIASQPSADQSVAREIHWLRTLGSLPSMARFLPHLLRDGTLLCGRRFLTMSVLPFGALSARFCEPHFRFLQMLAGRSFAVTHWSGTEPFKRLSERVGAVTGLLEPQYGALFVDILSEIEIAIGGRQLPVCLVHGDFAPWNLRVAGTDLLVFDWEYAEERGNPLQDFLHFHLVTRATRHRAIGIGFIRRLVVRAAEHADRVFGADSGVAAAAGALTLHYLLDTIAFYTEASLYLDINDPVVRGYLELLEERHRWLESPASVAGVAHAG